MFAGCIIEPDRFVKYKIQPVIIAPGTITSVFSADDTFVT